MKKKLSVLVPSYNFSNFISDCIDSIYKQKTNFDFDVIIRDDNSTDDTKDKLLQLKKKYPSLIILDGSENLGAFNNIKRLYESTNSEYIAYLDGDDLFGDEDKLQKQVDFLDSNPKHVMCFTGCRYLYEDGRIHPDDSRVICSVKDIITTDDLLQKNYVGFGRMFRNIPNILKDEYSELPYVDWPMGYELSKYGLIEYLDMFGGLYRISDSGIYSKLSEEEKMIGFNKVKKTLSENYAKENFKTITIVDCFISNHSVLTKLENSIHNLKKRNHEVLLVSNTIPPNHILELVDYFLYNKENKLFKEKYSNLGLVDLWKAFPQITIHEIHEEFQKHGLSVLCNLFNCLDLSKSLGYTHFQRIEVDDLFSNEGYDFMEKVPSLCQNENKKSLFYFNSNEDLSFHYFFSEIDFFLNNVFRIDSEDTYLKYLLSNDLGMSFRPVEVYLYENLIKNDIDNVLVRDGYKDMNEDFYGTIWNTETSQATINEKYEGCTTKIYRIQNSENIAIVSYNYNNFPVNRKIIVKLDKSEDIIYHNLDYFDAWAYNIFDPSVKEILVYDNTNNKLLYQMNNINIEDFIELK